MQSHSLALYLFLLLLAANGGGCAARRGPRDDIQPTAAPPSAAVSPLVLSLCAHARYAPLCVRTLSTSAAKTVAGLAGSAVTAALRSALALSRSSAAIAPDCTTMLADAALKLARTEAALVGDRNEWRPKIDDCRTWASAAMTDADMCIVMLAGGGADVAERVSEVSRLTSNALYLLARLAAATGRHD